MPESHAVGFGEILKMWAIPLRLTAWRRNLIKNFKSDAKKESTWNKEPLEQVSLVSSWEGQRAGWAKLGS